MAKYIECEAAYRFAQDQLKKETGAYSKGWNNAMNVMKGALHNNDALPAADVRPVVHGKWVQKREQTTIDSYWIWIRWECSECGYCRTKGWEHSSDGKKPRAKLCEMCGALMDKDGDA